MYHDKIKAGLSLTQECLDLLEQGKNDLSFRSKNELAETAIRFYIAYHTAEIHTDFLRKVMTEGCVDAMKITENRIAKIAYKGAVETAMINLALMDSMDLSEKQIQKYRNKAVAILNQTHEHLTLGRAKKQPCAERYILSTVCIRGRRISPKNLEILYLVNTILSFQTSFSPKMI